MVVALTTPFAGASSCLTPTQSWGYSALWYGESIDCWPTLPGPLYYYSPAVCPSGYYSACSLETGYTYTSAEITLAAGEFGHRCCPSGYTCTSSDYAPYVCRSFVSSTLTVPYFSPISSGGAYRSVGSTFTSPPYLVITAVVVKYKAADITLFPSSVATRLSGYTTPSSTLPTTTRTTSTTTPPPTPTGTGGISQGTKIAIGVAVPIIVLSLAALIATIFFFRRRGRQSTAAPTTPAPIIQYVVAAPPAQLPENPALNSKTTYIYQPPASPPIPSAVQGGPAPGYHDMAHEGPGYQVWQDGTRS